MLQGNGSHTFDHRQFVVDRLHHVGVDALQVAPRAGHQRKVGQQAGPAAERRATVREPRDGRFVEHRWPDPPARRSERSRYPAMSSGCQVSRSIRSSHRPKQRVAQPADAQAVAGQDHRQPWLRPGFELGQADQVRHDANSPPGRRRRRGSRCRPVDSGRRPGGR